MSNVHTPERRAGESQAQHRERQRTERRMCALHPLRDENGAYTLVGATHNEPFLNGTAQHVAANGQARRIWLAGISAQRGY